ncbi:hypothetical protein [Kozakia baliensis]|uniref:hypothetical protein n=1 Tax=Kozakia baliensis TaxID=153496 RepID=UPI00055FFE2E|nr:hypothetical protein [Kozakia baliensis]
MLDSYPNPDKCADAMWRNDAPVCAETTNAELFEDEASLLKRAASILEEVTEWNTDAWVGQIMRAAKTLESRADINRRAA